MSEPRRNAFGEAYCVNADQVRREVDNESPDEGVYMSRNSIDEDDGKWAGEVTTNGDGGTVCYIEADTKEGVLAIAAEARIEVTG